MKKVLIAVAASLLPVAACARDHLEPVRSALSDIGGDATNRYLLDVRKVFAEIFGEDIRRPERRDHQTRARVIVNPSFRPEYGVAIRSKFGVGFELVTIDSSMDINGYEALRNFDSGRVRGVIDYETGRDGTRRSIERAESDKRIKEQYEALRRSLPAQVEDVPVALCIRPMADNVAVDFLNIWSEMLRRTRYSQRNTPEFDGDTYYFSGQVPEGYFGSMEGQIWSPDERSLTGRLIAIVEGLRIACSSKDDKLLTSLASDARRLRRDVLRAEPRKK